MWLNSNIVITYEEIKYNWVSLMKNLLIVYDSVVINSNQYLDFSLLFNDIFENW